MTGITTEAETLEQHLDPKNWTKDSLLDHLFDHDDRYYFTTRSTKKDFEHSHRRIHEREIERAATLARRQADGTIASLRGAFGCRVSDDTFASADDAWMADHIRRHETGDDLGGRLL